MSLICKMLFTISLLTALPAILMVFIFRKKEFSYKDIWLKGSSIMRHLPNFVREKYVKPIQALSYVFISSFLMGIIWILFSNVWQYK